MSDQPAANANREPAIASDKKKHHQQYDGVNAREKSKEEQAQQNLHNADAKDVHAKRLQEHRKV